MFRLGTLYGVGDDFSRLRVDLVVNTLTIRAALNERMSVFGGQTVSSAASRAGTSGRIVVEAMTTGERGVFNLGSENATVLEVAEAVRHLIPDAEHRRHRDRSSRTTATTASRAVKAHEQLGLRPRASRWTTASSRCNV